MYVCKYCQKEFEQPNSRNGHQGACPQNPSNNLTLNCEFCGEVIIGKRVHKQHEAHCTCNPNAKIYKNTVIKVPEEISYCRYCDRVCHNIISLKTHERVCPENPDREISQIELHRASGNYIQWNKGSSKYEDERIAKQSASLKEYYKDNPGTFLGKTHSKETKDKLSEIQTELWHSDSNRYSRCYSGYFEGIYFMSSWELAYYIYTKDQGKDVKRCTKRFKYTYKGKNHYYYPDFIVDGQIVETKGLESEVDLIKYKSVPDLLVLKEADLVPMVEYVRNKYKLKDIYLLYDKDE